MAAGQDAEAVVVLISWIQPGPLGGSLAGFGRHGAMVEQGRKGGRRIKIEGMAWCSEEPCFGL